MALDTAQAAREILAAVGGPSNVVSAAHCATRLRLVIADDSKVDKDAVEDALGAKGNFQASGQLQIIYGTGTVNKVYDEFCKQGNISAVSKEELKDVAAGNQNKFMAAIKASGMLMGIMGAIEFMGNAGMIALDTNSVWWRIAGLINACALANLQTLLGFSAATVFGGNPYLGASFGALLISGSFINAYAAADAIANGTMITLEVIPGLYSIDWIGYQGHVIPILVGTWILCTIEKKMHQIVPDMFDLFVTPLVSVAGAAYITILFIGPIFVWLENAILGLLTALLSVPFGLGYILIGLIYSPSVVTGLHQMYTTIDVSMLGQYGVTYWLPIASAANIAQGGACLAVALKTKSEKTKALAIPSGISCLLGITEPAIFGVNLPKLKPFLCGMAGAAVGAFICSMTQLAATGTGVTGIFGILLCINQPVQYIIMFVASFGVAFAGTWVLYSDEPDKQKAAKAAAPAAPTHVDAIDAAGVLASPMTGTAKAMSDAPDAVFASLAMGNGAVVEPVAGEVYSPVTGTVTMLFDTQHAIGLAADDGTEVLIHIGVDTVELAGKPFTAHVAAGDSVKAGDLLITADLDAIKAAGKPTATMVIVTNTDDYASVTPEVGAVSAGEKLVTVSK